MRKSTVCLVVVTLSVLGLGAAPTTEPKTISDREIGRSVVVLGRLDVPIGQAISIRGTKKRNGPYLNAFHVESVDGKPKQAVVHIDGIDNWPENTEATLRGYEKGTIRFLHARDTNIGPGIEFAPHQKLFLSFTAEAVVEPAGLKLNDVVR